MPAFKLKSRLFPDSENIIMKKTTIFIFFLLLAVTGSTLQAHTRTSPGKASDILTTAQKVNTYFMNKYPDPTQPTFVKKERSSNLWTRAVYYEGLMALYEVDKNPEYIDYTDRWAEFHQWSPRNGVNTTNADDQCCEQTYLERFIQSGGQEKIEKVKENLDLQMASGKHTYWTWIDAIQMAMPLYAKYAKITGERKYLDYAINSYKWSRDTLAGGLFNKEEGLWWRDKDYVAPYKETDGRNCYWSRGNGWVYAALVRVLQTLRKNDKDYQFLKGDYLLMSRALIKCQRKDGFWNPSLVSSSYEGPETSGTSLFLYGMSWGVQNGLLKNRSYRQACDKAWKAIKNIVHGNGFIGYSQGTGKDPAAGQPVNSTHIPDFEDFGTGCFLLGAAGYARLIEYSR